MKVRVAIAVLCLALASCGAEASVSKPVQPRDDASTDALDSGSGGSDAMTPDRDAGDPSDEPDAGQPSAGHDVFGVSELYPTAQGGLEWDSRWWEGAGHNVPFDEADPADPLGLANQRGDGMVRVEGDGTLRLTGTEPRIYIGTNENHPWLNVEITAYYQRVEDDDTNWAGLVIGARSAPDGHGIDNCKATTYYARFRNDGNADVEKELEHPGSLERETTPLWDGADPPHDTWIGMKYVVTNVDGGQHVRLQVFRDLTEGENGGDWQPVIDSTDTGGWAPPHSCDYASDFIITQGGGVVLIRNTGVTGQGDVDKGALYKWVTIREIDPLP